MKLTINILLELQLHNKPKQEQNTLHLKITFSAADPRLSKPTSTRK
jgi:hypothetical protein